MSAPLGIILALASMFGWGIADFLAKKIIDKIGSFWSLLYMQAIGIIPIFIYSLLLGIPVLSFNMSWIVIVTSVSLIVGYLFFYKGFETGNVSIVSPISSCYTIIAVVLSIFIFGENLTNLQLFAIFIIIIGLILTSSDFSKIRKSMLATGVGFAILTMLSWGVSFTLMKIPSVVYGPFITMLYIRFIGIVFLSFLWKARRVKINIPKSKILYILVIIGLLDAMAFITFSRGVISNYVSIISPISACYPAVTIMLAFIFLKEKILMNQKIGIVSILTGLVLISIV